MHDSPFLFIHVLSVLVKIITHLGLIACHVTMKKMTRRRSNIPNPHHLSHVLGMAWPRLSKSFIVSLRSDPRCCSSCTSWSVRRLPPHFLSQAACVTAGPSNMRDTRFIPCISDYPPLLRWILAITLNSFTIPDIARGKPRRLHNIEDRSRSQIIGQVKVHNWKMMHSQNT